MRRCGLLEELVKRCPFKRTSPDAAPVDDVVQSFALTALRDSRPFAHVNRIREDPTVRELLGIKPVVGDDTIRRLLSSLETNSSAQ